MTPEKRREIQHGNMPIPQEDYLKGWHFCREWDFMLIGPGDPEMDSCKCYHSPHCSTCED